MKENDVYKIPCKMRDYEIAAKPEDVLYSSCGTREYRVVKQTTTIEKKRVTVALECVVRVIDDSQPIEAISSLSEEAVRIEL